MRCIGDRRLSLARMATSISERRTVTAGRNNTVSVQTPQELQAMWLADLQCGARAAAHRPRGSTELQRRRSCQQRHPTFPGSQTPSAHQQKQLPSFLYASKALALQAPTENQTSPPTVRVTTPPSFPQPCLQNANSKYLPSSKSR